MLPHPPREQVVAPPPKEEEAAEQQGRLQAVIHAADAVVAPHLPQTVHRPAVQPLALARGVLDLQARLDVLDGRRDEAHRRAGQDAREAVAVRGQRQRRVVERVQRRVEQVVLDQPPVHGQAAQHDAVHEHPAHERRRRAFVEAY